ncbi:MAG: general secretion pathway protein L [Halioglobus sp.]
MQDNAVVRLTDKGLVWYGAGTGDAPRSLGEESVRAQLIAAASQPGAHICFAVPGADVRLCTREIDPQEKKHLEKTLPFMLEDELISELDDVHFSTEMADKYSVNIAICGQQKMLDWQPFVADYPNVTRWLPEPLLLPWQAGEWCLVIESHQVIVRMGAFEGFSIEPELLLVTLQAALHSNESEPAAIVIYGDNQSHDSALLPEELQPLIQWRRGDLSAALMLAGQVSSSPINLLQGEFGVRLPLALWWRQWRSVAAVIAVAFCVQLAATYADYASLKDEQAQLQQAVVDSYREVYPDGAIVDAEKQLKRQLRGLRGSGQTSGFVSLIQRVGEVVSRSSGTQIASINYNDKAEELRMNISAADFEAVEDIRTAMNTAGLEAVMESSSAQGERVRARMRVGAGS